MIHKRKYIIRVKRIIPFNISYELIDYSEKGNISKDKKELNQIRYHIQIMILCPLIYHDEKENFHGKYIR